MSDINVLYVDDELENLNSFKACFRRDFNVILSSSALEARSILESTDIHVLVTDQRMPGTTGVVLLSESVKLYPNVSRILLTGYADFEALVEAINIGRIFKYLEKPWDEEKLKSCILEAHKICLLKRDKDLFIKKLKLTNTELELSLKNINP